MKKLIIGVVAVLGFVLVQPAQAEENKTLVIIDSYFDSRVASPSFKCIVVATKDLCKDSVSVIPKSLSSNINHGNAMVEVSRRQNPNINIIGLVSASSPSSDVNAGTFVEALSWVDNNSTGVGAVSISRYFNGATTCSPASVNTAPYGGVVGVDLKIKELIYALNSKGIKVFASTGNVFKQPVGYPACISQVNSVSVGSINKLGVTVSSFQFDAFTSYFASSSVFSYTTPIGLVANTTSAGTVAVATQYLSKSILTKIVAVVR